MYQNSSQNPRRGSVLLMALLITGLVAALSLTFGSSVRNQLNLARDDAGSLQAELAAQSGVEFARRQLLLDPLWDGTNGAKVMLDKKAGFIAARKAGDKSSFRTTTVDVVVEGSRNDAVLVRLETSMKVIPGDPLRTKSFAILGGDMGAQNLTMNGDVLLADMPNRIWAYDPSAGGGGGSGGGGGGSLNKVGLNQNATSQIPSGAGTVFSNSTSSGQNSQGSNSSGQNSQGSNSSGQNSQGSNSGSNSPNSGPGSLNSGSSASDDSVHEPDEEGYENGKTKVNTAGKIRPTGAWTPGSQNGTPPTYTLNSVDVTGTLHTFLPIAYLGTDQDQKQVKMPIHAPGWNLDEYTLGGSRILLYNGVTQVNGLDTDKTAVFNLAPGQTLTLQDVNIRGGVVLFVEADYNPFDPAARNDLILLGNAVIGGGSGGAYAQIGLIAPGARLATSSASSSAVRKLKGLSMVHSIDTAKRLKVKGQLFVYTDIQAILDSQITYDEETAKDTPGGIFFFSGFPAVDVEKVSESYDPVAGL